MSPKKPPSDGAYPGDTELHDGVVWTWDGRDWRRGELPGVTHKLERVWLPDEDGAS